MFQDSRLPRPGPAQIGIRRLVGGEARTSRPSTKIVSLEKLLFSWWPIGSLDVELVDSTVTCDDELWPAEKDDRNTSHCLCESF
jgi:hypothetical protein